MMARAGGGVPRSAFLGDPLSVVLDAGGGQVYAALDLGHFGVKLQRSDDDGASWREMAPPAYPPKPEGLDDRDANGKPVEWRGDKSWAPAAGGGGAAPPPREV